MKASEVGETKKFISRNNLITKKSIAYLLRKLKI